MTGIQYSLGLDASKGIAGLSAMRSAFSGFTGMVGKIGGIVGFAGGLGLAGAAVAGFKKAIDEAANMETLQTSFSVLLGSMGEARVRMEELTKFAADTPFELPEVAAASRTLETMTRGALSTGKGLALVGDVASATNQPFEEIAGTIGRVYEALNSGRESGEAMRRLQELGAVSGETRTKIEQLQGAGQKGGAVWAIAAQALGRFSGMMEQQSTTWNGLMSTLKDGVTGVFREFGTPILTELKPFLTEGIALTDRLANAARSAGEGLATGIGFLREEFGKGTFSEIVGLSLRAGFSTAVKWLADKLSDIFSKIGEIAPKMFAGISTLFDGIAQQFGLSMRNAMTGLPTDPADIAVANNQKMLGMKQIGHALGGPARGLFDGLATNGDDAQKIISERLAGFTQRQQQAAMLESANGTNHPAASAIGPVMEAARGMVEKNSSSLSDRLSKIGGFIGGAGGVRGEKAQQDTARNTQNTTNAVRDMHRMIEAKLAHAGAAF